MAKVHSRRECPIGRDVCAIVRFGMVKSPTIQVALIVDIDGPIVSPWLFLRNVPVRILELLEAQNRRRDLGVLAACSGMVGKPNIASITREAAATLRVTNRLNHPLGCIMLPYKRVKVPSDDTEPTHWPLV